MLSVSDVKNFVWCPAILYIKRVLGFHERVTEYMVYGKEVEVEKYVYFLCSKFNCVKVIRNLKLIDNNLGLYGIIDWILINKFNEYIPIDIKWSNVINKPRNDHVIQVTLYAILIENCLNVKVKLAILYYVTRIENKLFKIYITHNLKNKALKILNEAKKVLMGNLPKFKIDKSKCIGCNYSLWCIYYRT